MAKVYADNVRQTTTSGGVGNLTLGPAATGRRELAAVMADGDTATAEIRAAGGEWESTTITYTAPAGTVSRADVPDSSSNAGQKVDFQAGTVKTITLAVSERDVLVRDRGETVSADWSFSGAVTLGGSVIQSGPVTQTGPLAMPSSELTIAAGVITPVRASHTVDTEADAASDDLDLIDATNTTDGALLLLAAENGARSVVVKHNSGMPTGNQLRIFLSDDADFPLDDAEKWLVLIRRGTAWQEIGRSRLELPAATTSVSGTVERATLPEIRDGTTDNKFGSSKDYYDSAAEVALTSSTNAVAWNMASGINSAIDTLAENTAISNPTNAVAGKSGYLRIVQDATGSRTVDWGSNFVFRGGEKPVATTVANAEDVFFYICLSATAILIIDVLDAKAAV